MPTCGACGVEREEFTYPLCWERCPSCGRESRLLRKPGEKFPDVVVAPGQPRHPREPEPCAILSYGGVEIRIGLTFMHHLEQCRGWGDNRTTTYLHEADMLMKSAVEEIGRRMYSESTPPYPCDYCGEGNNASHPIPASRDECGKVTKYKWVCRDCRYPPGYTSEVES